MKYPSDLAWNGVPLSKVDAMRNLLQRAGYALTDSSHLKTFIIPKIEEEEMKILCMELECQHISTAFDSTTRMGEAVNMVNRWCTHGFQIKTRLTMFRTVEKHMDNK